ncbi:type II secretion system secretin GspD [Moraxella osloensis]|uniref:Type II secretion system protein GspD n=1 Tax=Faucicola osloensis TaxID=34062 RepID=A0A2D2LT32_FAUOS|nr:type II secretion system secretin GspD [Moraxella osloensis]ATR78174.1 type II secretion system protein GspD [Moraxella osloensis]
MKYPTMLKPLFLSTTLAMSISLLSTGLSAAHAATGYKVHLQDADIKAFIDQIASITQKSFVLDPRINGNVTVISNKPLSRQEVYDLFLAVMKVNGIVAIDRGLTTELVPDTVAKQAGVDVDLRGNTAGSQMATRIYYLTNTNANDILNVIRPMMPPYANAAIVPNVNAIILSDRADSLNQYAKLISELDSNMNDKLTIIPLRHVDAKRMMDLLSSLTGTSGGTAPAAAGQSGQAAVASTGGSLINIIADPISDRLLVKGSAEMTAKVQRMVEQLDTVPTQRLSGLRVFRLKYASATHIAEMLRGLLANQSINSSGDQTTLQASSMFQSSSDTSNNSAATSNTAASPTGSPLNTASTSNTTSTQNSGYQGRPFSIIADQTQNSVIVNANPELMVEIENAINELDTRRDQVLIQAAIMEISGNDTQQLGVQWAMGNANSGVGVINFNNIGASAVGLASDILSKTPGTAAASVAGALLGIGTSKTDSNGNREFYGAILQAINKTNNANLLSMPSILTLDNEKANILVGQNVPFVTGSYTTASNSSTTPFQTVSRQDVGINLNVIPHIGDNGSVRLEISQEVSSIVDGTLNNVSGVVTNKNLIKTTILADNQQTVALGGLMRDNSTYGQQKVPGLGDAPIIGNLFRSKSKNSDKTNLIVFLQPTILRNGSAVASVTEKSLDGIRTMQLVIDKNGTLKQIPLNINAMFPNTNRVENGVKLPTDDLVTPAEQSLSNTPRVYANGVDIVTPASSNVSRTGSSSTTSVSRQASNTVTQATITQSTVTQSTAQTGQGAKMAQTPVVIATPPAVQTITVTNP